MTITVPTAAVEGIRLSVAPLHTEAVIGTTGLRHLAPSPKTEKDSRSLEYTPGPLRHAEEHAPAQRTPEPVPEARNVTACASGLLGFGGGKDSCGRAADTLHPGTGYDHKSSGR